MRQEVKYLLSPEEGPAVLRALDDHLPAKTVDGSAQSYRASVYLDVPERELVRGALTRGSQTTKLRVKEYYLVENGKPKNDGRCFIEVKVRTGSMVEKCRFACARPRVPAVLRDGPEPAADPLEQADREAFEEIRAGRILEPVVVAHYRRFTYQSKDSRLRITVDDELTFHVPPRGLFGDGVPLTARIYLPPPIAIQSAWIVEVKCLGLAPGFVSEILGHRKEADFSKFAFGVQTLAAKGLLGDLTAEEKRR